ncbi:MAG TPA: hypothetical protein ENI41_05745, partial [Deltaproteobacteria bacterium]|nr:hypothetical protein [Deltaproteobacteria bacterium]
MGNGDFVKQRAAIYKFLSTLYRDEISKDLVLKLTDKDFVKRLQNFAKECTFSDLGKGAGKIAKYLGNTKIDTYKDLSYEYADLFLNAGKNPAFPYESVHVTGKPIVMQEPVFKIREIFHKAGVHKSKDYKDLDDHIAVELEFVQYLLDKGETDAAQEFINTHLINWIPEFHATLYFAATTDFYKGLSLLTQSFLFRDLYPDNEQYKNEIAKLSSVVEGLNLAGDYVTIAKGSREPEPEKTIPTHCYICGALCGQKATVRDGILIKTSGLKGDPKGGGAI